MDLQPSLAGLELLLVVLHSRITARERVLSLSLLFFLEVGNMTEEIPSEFTDDEKWFKFFPKTAFLFLVVAIFFILLFANLLKGFGLFVPTIIVGAIPTLIIVALMMIKCPESEYLKGGGQTYWTLFVKKFLRRMKAVLYVRGWDGL